VNFKVKSLEFQQNKTSTVKLTTLTALKQTTLTLKTRGRFSCLTRWISETGEPSPCLPMAIVTLDEAVYHQSRVLLP